MLTPHIDPQFDRAARRAALSDQHDTAVEMTVAAMRAWESNPLDPSGEMNFEACRERCESLSRQINGLREDES